jgi:hypothetical protein
MQGVAAVLPHGTAAVVVERQVKVYSGNPADIERGEAYSQTLRRHRPHRASLSRGGRTHRGDPAPDASARHCFLWCSAFQRIATKSRVLPARMDEEDELLERRRVELPGLAQVERRLSPAVGSL